MKRNIEFYLSEDVKSKLKSKGIYLLTNLKNQKRYVGSTYRDFKERFKEHCGMYNIYLKEGGRIALPILWTAFNKYGLNSFKAEILEIMDDASDQEILNKEEYYIKLLNPEYNVCQEPSKNGSPNKNKKLSEEWKKKISEKAKLYKHDKETLALVTENNKQNACKIKFIKDSEVLEFSSWVEAAKHFNVLSKSAMITAYSKNKTYHGYKIEKLSKQAKTIKLYYENNEIKIFNSFNECDRFLNMWRGYTSEQYNRKKTVLKDKYKFEVL